MVQFIQLPESTRSKENRAAFQSLGANLGERMGYDVRRQRLGEALDQAMAQAKQPGAKPLDVFTSLAKVGAEVPGFDRYLSTAFPLLLQQMQAEASQNAFGGIGPQSNTQQQPPGSASSQPLVGGISRGSAAELGGQTPLERVGEQSNRFFPTNVGGNQSPGNAPQEATTGEIRPILSPEKIIEEAVKLSQIYTSSGKPTTVEQAFDIVKGLNDQNLLYNQQVESERLNRIQAQEAVGDLALNELKRVYKDAGPEEEAIIQEAAEKELGKNKSQADIKRTITKEASKLKQAVTSVRSSLSPERLQNKLQRAFSGETQSFDALQKELKTKIKPLLDLGLYSKARNVLGDLGLYPEEVESTIFPLNPNVEKATAIFDPLRRERGDIGTMEATQVQATPHEIQRLGNAIEYMFKLDPNVNLLSLRKRLEDKKVDWREYKDAINELIGQERIKISDDQRQQLDLISTPPLTNLGKILHNIGLRGR